MKPDGCIPTRARPARRAFLETTLALGAGTLIAPSLDAQGSSPATRADVKPPLPTVLPELPARVFVDHDGSRLERALSTKSTRWMNWSLSVCRFCEFW